MGYTPGLGGTLIVDTLALGRERLDAGCTWATSWGEKVTEGVRELVEREFTEPSCGDVSEVSRDMDGGAASVSVSERSENIPGTCSGGRREGPGVAPALRTGADVSLTVRESAGGLRTAGLRAVEDVDVVAGIWKNCAREGAAAAEDLLRET